MRFGAHNHALANILQSVHLSANEASRKLKNYMNEIERPANSNLNVASDASFFCPAVFWSRVSTEI
jgi:hypothetical protein